MVTPTESYRYIIQMRKDRNGLGDSLILLLCWHSYCRLQNCEITLLIILLLNVFNGG